ncbi:MAG: competence/damage-inducible protein A [Ruminococcaceae bacterium]|jgi:nicotinamide-nucleotide amidase|nr:competence/damage-inducible protein A [Oscillospiraceae bacterium]
MAHRAELIAVGTELLLGNIANLDAQILSEKLAELGIDVLYHTVVGDNPARLRQALELARTRVDVILTTGGLGPTYDDLTKQTICEVFGRKNVLHPELESWLRALFADRGRPMTENNLQQAYLPENCTVFHNQNGTAPGCAFCEDGVHVLMLPGPPHECELMFRTGAEAYLRALSHEVIASHTLRIYGKGESEIEALLHDRIVNMTNPTVAPYAKSDECMLRVTAKASSPEAAEQLLAPAVAEVMGVVGEWVYGVDVDNLETVCLDLLKSRSLTLSTAESCTGGLIAKRLTDISGASAAFLGGVVSYTNGVKNHVLNVSQSILDEYGAVSEPTARAMAEGVRALTGSDYALAVTGLAGPDGDDRGNPVGLVFVALAGPDGTAVRECRFGKRTREHIRQQTANTAFDMLRRKLQ